MSNSPPPDAPYATIGVDLGGTQYKVGWRRGGALRDVVCYPTGGHRDVSTVLTEVEQAIGQCRAAVEQTGATVAAIGVGIPSVIDVAEGRILLLPNFSQSWQGHGLAADLRARTGLPVHLINDARAYTLAEARRGAGQGVDDLLCVTIGTGVGGGLVLDGELRFGPNMMAGEFGHISIDPHGPRCGCGGLGCIESYASASAIAGMALRSLQQGRVPILRDLVSGNLARLSADAVASAAMAGEQECQEIFIRAGEAIGLGVAHVMKIVDISRVVVGGGVAVAGDLLLEPIRATARVNSAVFGDRQPDIVTAQIDQPGATGAAIWAAEQEQSEGSDL